MIAFFKVMINHDRKVGNETEMMQFIIVLITMTISTFAYYSLFNLSRGNRLPLVS